MSKLLEATLTVAEAAYVAGVTERTVNHEIDARILRSRGRKERRAVRGADVLYLGAVREVRHQMAPELRRRMREAIASAVSQSRPVARVAAFEVKITPLEHAARRNFAALERVRRDCIESRPGVLAGEPVIKGTRIPARLIADLVRQGVSHGTISREYDLTRAQTEAAVLFDRVTPRRGRPPVRRLNVKSYFAERARRASVPKALKILRRAGAGRPPMKGDELPAGRKRR
jgi:uncharacterized protein (DUF433 family)